MVQEDRVNLSKILVLCGPTGVGKTALGISLAQKLKGEILMADSQAIWKKLDIGTAKPTPADQNLIPHHLIDCANWGESFDVAEYARMAEVKIAEVQARGHLPILSGGTGLYLKAVLYGLMEAPKRDVEFRKILENRAAAEGSSVLHTELTQIDPSRAQQIHPNDLIRLIRALEIYHFSKTPPTQLQNQHQFSNKRYATISPGLTRPREELHARIDQRVIEMIQTGWVEEVKMRMEEGYDFLNTKTLVIGYSTLARHLKGEISLKDAISEIQQQTRRLAKRQLTWFRADKSIRWFHPENENEILEWICQQFSKSSAR